MTDVLFPYQIDGAEFLAARSCALLADEMGLGKSAQAIRACDLTHSLRVLVLCPAAGRINWTREFEEFGILPRVFHIIDAREMNEVALRDEQTSLICSYDLAPKLLANLKENGARFDALILDESHFLKGTETKRTAAVLGKSGLVRMSNKIWALSGTPAPNNASELWPILITFGRYIKSFESFVSSFCTTKVRFIAGAKRLQILGTKEEMLPELRKLLRPIMLRRKKEEVMKELPSIKYERLLVEAGKVEIEMQPTFAKYFITGDRTDELMDKLMEEQAALETVAKAVRSNSSYKDPHSDLFEAVKGMADSVSTIRRYTGMQKVEPLVRLVIDELERKEYEKIVIFAVHVDVIAGIRDRLMGSPLYHKDGFTKDYNPVTFYGGTPPEKRQKHIDKFQRDTKTKIFIGQIQAAGTAITLTAAHQVLFAEQSWVPGDNAQAAMRVHRIGQTKPVTVRFASIAGSIDEKISEALRRKTQDLQKIFDVERETLLTKSKCVSKTNTHDLEQVTANYEADSGGKNV